MASIKSGDDPAPPIPREKLGNGELVRGNGLSVINFHSDTLYSRTGPVNEKLHRIGNITQDADVLAQRRQGGTDIDEVHAKLSATIAAEAAEQNYI